MLSYNEWKLLNETLGGPVPLGVSTPQSIGISGANDVQSVLDEAKKKLKKKKKCQAKKCSKMNADMDMDMGDEEEELDIKAKKPDLDVDPDKPEPEVDDDDDDDEVDIEDKVDDEGDEELDVEKKPPMDKPPMDKPPMFSKKKSKKKSAKKMKKEQDEFFQSLSKQMSGGTTDTKYWDGISEDAVFNPPDPNRGLADMAPEVDDNPGPGEVGFGPSTRIQH
jgi:hypothetical protein